MQDMMAQLRLTVNETKTRISRLPEATFDFLGYTFGRQYSRQTGGAYLGPKPAKQKIGRLCDAISTVTDRRTTWQNVREVMATLNSKLRGWANYFCVSTVVHAYEVVLGHTRRRLRRWLCAKHKVRRGGDARFSNAYLHRELRLHLFPGCTHGLAVANS
jgi:RNA-directed DNA polymerase